ncbi:MAG: metallophosphoesterase [Cyanobacteria bacterium P01_E01_bin.42]
MNPIFLESLKIERLTVKIEDLSSSLQGTKIIHLSDFHYDGKRLSESLLAEVVDISNQENPDLILLTGDYVTDDPTPIHGLTLRLKKIESRFGIFASLGNHDNYLPYSRKIITRALQNANIRVLWNEVDFPMGRELAIIGFADLWSKEFNPHSVFPQIAPHVPRIVLSHNPDTAELLDKWRVDLQLSGHTHGGQIVIPPIGVFQKLLEPLRQTIPRFFHPYIPILRECARVVRHWEWASGYHQVGRNHLYVNRGLGTYFPGRFYCPPELTVITLV